VSRLNPDLLLSTLMIAIQTRHFLVCWVDMLELMLLLMLVVEDTFLEEPGGCWNTIKKRTPVPLRLGQLLQLIGSQVVLVF
jgi:hypothetical protein